jgi:hypothetical protein
MESGPFYGVDTWLGFWRWVRAEWFGAVIGISWQFCPQAFLKPVTRESLFFTPGLNAGTKATTVVQVMWGITPGQLGKDFSDLKNEEKVPWGVAQRRNTSQGWAHGIHLLTCFYIVDATFPRLREALMGTGVVVVWSKLKKKIEFNSHSIAFLMATYQQS